MITLGFQAFYIKYNYTSGKITYFPSSIVATEHVNNGEFLQEFECPTESLQGIIFKITAVMVEDKNNMCVALMDGSNIVEEWTVDKFKLKGNYCKSRTRQCCCKLHIEYRFDEY